MPGGIWASDDKSVVFGHRRLSIIDLSENGAQPMHSASGRYVCVFNGEIYNYRTIRDKLLVEKKVAAFREALIRRFYLLRLKHMVLGKRSHFAKECLRLHCLTERRRKSH